MTLDDSSAGVPAPAQQKALAAVRAAVAALVLHPGQRVDLYRGAYPDLVLVRADDLAALQHPASSHSGAGPGVPAARAVDAGEPVAGQSSGPTGAEPGSRPLARLRLSAREVQVLSMSDGRTAAQVAAQLGLAANTVAQHLVSVRRKYAVRTTAAALAAARVAGEVPPQV